MIWFTPILHADLYLYTFDLMLDAMYGAAIADCCSRGDTAAVCMQESQGVNQADAAVFRAGRQPTNPGIAAMMKSPIHKTKALLVKVNHSPTIWDDTACIGSLFMAHYMEDDR